MTRVTVEQVEAASTASPASTEQAADLAQLQAMAGAEPPPPADPNAPPEPLPVDLATEISQALTIISTILSPALPSLRDIYTPEATGAAGQAIAGVCNKHGWLAGGFLGQWGEELACLVVVGPLAVATYRGVSADLVKLREKAKAKDGAPPAVAAPEPGAYVVPGSKTVSFGNAAPAEFPA